MAYRLLAPDDVGSGIRAIVHDQASKALAHLDDPNDLGPDETIHDVRKRLKRLRAAVRLVRPGLGDVYDDCNRAFRDAGRALSDLRDARAIATTAHVLATMLERPPNEIVAIRRVLNERADATRNMISSSSDAMRSARALTAQGMERIDGAGTLTLDDIAAGIGKTYKRASSRFDDARAEPSDSHLHEWRKRVKYLWNEAKLLRNAAPSIIVPYAKRLHDLSDTLGDDHDLAVLLSTLWADPAEFGGESAVQSIAAPVGRIRADLHDRAFRLAGRLLAETPDAFTARIHAMCEAWAVYGPERSTGEISEIYRDRSLDDWSRAELYEEAQRLDIPGRSSMRRHELAIAVRSGR